MEPYYHTKTPLSALAISRSVSSPRVAGKVRREEGGGRRGPGHSATAAVDAGPIMTASPGAMLATVTNGCWVKVGCHVAWDMSGPQPELSNVLHKVGM